MDLSRKKLTLEALTSTFVPFGLLLVVAMMAAESTQNLSMYRAGYSAGLSMVFMGAAYCVYILPGTTPKKTAYWLLCWTFGYLAFLIYTLYMIIGVYGGDIGAMYDQQGVVNAAGTLLFVLWWGLDVVLAWMGKASPPWSRAQRAALQPLLFLFFVLTALAETGFPFLLGLLLLFAAITCVLIRGLRSKS